MTNRSPKTIRCDDDLWEDFEKYAKDAEDGSRGAKPKHLENALREYLDKDRLGRVEDKVDALPDEIAEALSEKLPERERRKSKPESPSSPGTTAGSQTEQRLQTIVNEIPSDTSVSEALLETPIENHAGSSPKTLNKYKRLLTKRGHVFEHPIESDEYVTGERTFVLICENNPKISPDFVDYISGEYEDVLGEDWYLDALPDSIIASDTLKLEQVGGGDDIVEQYRRENGFLDDSGTGFQ